MTLGATLTTQPYAEQSPGVRIPMGPFPARLCPEGPHVVLEIVVGQLTDPTGIEHAWRQAGDVLRGIYGPEVTNPGVTYAPRSGGVIITYASAIDADRDEIQSMAMAGVLYAAFMAAFLEGSLTPEWRAQLRSDRVLGPQMADPRRLVGSTTAPWAAWSELAVSA